jgi:hypothetical protein
MIDQPIQSKKRRGPAFIVKEGSAIVTAYKYDGERFGLHYYRFSGDKRQVETRTGERRARARAEEIAIALANGRAQTLELTNADKDGYVYAKTLLPPEVPLHVAIEEWCAARSILGPNVGVVEAAREWKLRHSSEFCETFGYANVPPPAVRASKHGEGLPERPGIYFVWSGRVCVYVGCSRNLRIRCMLGDHPAIRPNEMLSWVTEPPERLRMAEAFYVGMLRPQRNFAGSQPKFVIVPS